MKTEIRGTLARGYCTDRNSHKVLDQELLEDIAAEIEQLIHQQNKEFLQFVINNYEYCYSEAENKDGWKHRENGWANFGYTWDIDIIHQKFLKEKLK